LKGSLNTLSTNLPGATKESKDNCNQDVPPTFKAGTALQRQACETRCVDRLQTGNGTCVCVKNYKYGEGAKLQGYVFSDAREHPVVVSLVCLHRCK